MTPIEEFFELQKDLERFNQKINGVITEKRKQIINDKQQHHLRINELKSNESKLNQQIQSLLERRQQVEQTVTHNVQDLEQQQAKLLELNAKQQELQAQTRQLEQEIDQVNSQIDKYNKDIEVSTSNLQAQNSKDDQEVLKFERYLGLKIEVIKYDLIRFIFINIDPNNIDKEFWVEIDLGNSDFNISNTSPTLEETEVSEILAEFNEKQEFGKFLKLMRTLFKNKI